ncbi:MAG: 50S ribosomal protein L1 [Candidatus Dormibacteria bacterium]|jgi:large subunit ribosomal protein L1
MSQQHGKNYRAALEKVEKGRLYAPQEAVELVRDTASARFDSTVEAHLRLGIDPRHADQTVRTTVVLPHGTGKSRRIAVFATGEKAREAADAGADLVGGEDLVKQVQAGEIDFDVALATPDVMGLVGRIGRILGPRGLMPNPKAGTVTFEIAKAIREVQGGRIEVRNDRLGNVHAPIGKASFEDAKLRDNFAALMEAVVRAKPPAAKGTFVKTVTLCTTHGPGVKVDPGQASKLQVA